MKPNASKDKEQENVRSSLVGTATLEARWAVSHEAKLDLHPGSNTRGYLPRQVENFRPHVDVGGGFMPDFHTWEATEMPHAGQGMRGSRGA